MKEEAEPGKAKPLLKTTLSNPLKKQRPSKNHWSYSVMKRKIA